MPGRLACQPGRWPTCAPRSSSAGPRRCIRPACRAWSADEARRPEGAHLPPLVDARAAAAWLVRSATSLGAHAGRSAACDRRGSLPRHAGNPDRSDEHLSRRLQRHACGRRTRADGDGRRRLAPIRRTRRARQCQPGDPARLQPGAKPDRAHLAVSAQAASLASPARQRRRHPQPGLRRLEQTHRTTPTIADQLPIPGTGQV